VADAMAGAIPIPGGGGLLGKIAGKISPWLGAAKAVKNSQVGQGVMQGVGAGVGWATGTLIAQPVKGFVGFFVNFIPENIYGLFVWAAALMYFWDWQTGFNIAATYNIHLAVFLVSFLTIGFTQKILSGKRMLSAALLFITLQRSTALFAAGIASTTLGNRIWFGLLFLAALFYLRTYSDAPPLFKYLPFIAFLDLFGIAWLSGMLLNFTANIGYGAFLFSFLLNRAIFPIVLWFSAATLYENTRVAKRLFYIMIIVYIFASVGHIKEAYNARLQPGQTAEQVQQTQSFKERVQAGIADFLSFSWFPTNSLYSKAEETFGFGTPKEEPQMGLTLRADPTMASDYDLDFNEVPTPSFIMAVPTPFPATVKEPFIKVLSATCKVTSSDGAIYTAKSVTTDDGEPLNFADTELSKRIADGTYYELYYGGSSYTGTTVTCSNFDKEPLPKGKTYTMEADVKYLVTTSAYLETSFMRADEVQALNKGLLDPATVKKLVPADAKYDNTPVSLTWAGPTNSPVAVDVGQSSTENIKLYVSKSSGWGSGDIFGIDSLTLKVPDSFTLGSGTCSVAGGSTCTASAFCLPDSSGSCKTQTGVTAGVVAVPKITGFTVATQNPAQAASGSGYRTTYVIASDRLKNSNGYRFFGDSASFGSVMTVDSNALLNGADWTSARFEAEVNVIFETKFTGASFTVKGTPPKTDTGSGSCGGTHAIDLDKLSLTKNDTNAAEYSSFKTACDSIKDAVFNEVTPSEICTCPTGQYWVSLDITKGCTTTKPTAALTCG